MATLPMISPEGDVYQLPQENMEKATARGLKPALVMTSPEGDEHYIPRENAQKAIARGFKTGQPAANQMADKGPKNQTASSAVRELAAGAGGTVAPEQPDSLKQLGRGLLDTFDPRPRDVGDVAAYASGPLAPVLLPSSRMVRGIGAKVKEGGKDIYEGAGSPKLGLHSASLQPMDTDKLAHGAGIGLGLTAQAAAPLAEDAVKTGAGRLRGPVADVINNPTAQGAGRIVRDFQFTRPFRSLGKELGGAALRWAESEKPPVAAPLPPPEPIPASAAQPEAPPVRASRVSDIPAPVRRGPGEVPSDIIGTPNTRVLAGKQGIRTTPRALLPANTEAPPVGTSPRLSPPKIELPERFDPRAEQIENKAFEESAREDLDRHGRLGFKSLRDEFEAGHKMDVPKGEQIRSLRDSLTQPEKLAPGWMRPNSGRLTVGSNAGAAADTAYFQAAQQALGAKAALSDVAQLAQKLKASGIAPEASLEELLKKSVEQAGKKK